MILPDVNVLLYAHRSDSSRHDEYREWFDGVLDGPSSFGVSEQVLGSVVRLATHPRIYKPPSPASDAWGFVRSIRESPLCRVCRPDDRHWQIFETLCRQSGATGNLISDAWFAALAIESGCIWATADRDFARFPGLAWMHPLDHQHPVTNP